MIKAVIFDFDGVVVESVDIKTKAFGKLFEDRGPAVMDAVVKYHMANTGVSRFDKFRHIYKEIIREALDEKTFETLCGRFSRLVVDDVIAAPYVEGAEDFLRRNVKRYLFYVISATPQDEIEQIVARRGMSDIFRQVYGSPHTKDECIKRVIEIEKLKPQEIVFVGDALGDYKAASVNKVRFIARLAHPKGLFDGVECPKVGDLKPLETVIADMNRKDAI